MKELKEQFEKETGQKYGDIKYDTYEYDYRVWLEKKVKEAVEEERERIKGIVKDINKNLNIKKYEFVFDNDEPDERICFKIGFRESLKKILKQIEG